MGGGKQGQQLLLWFMWYSCAPTHVQNSFAAQLDKICNIKTVLLFTYVFNIKTVLLFTYVFKVTCTASGDFSTCGGHG